MAVQAPGEVERHRFRVEGVVQGVGFRPWVFRLAQDLGLAGYVANDGSGVITEVEGPADVLEAFARALSQSTPRLASIEQIVVDQIPATGAMGFHVAASAAPSAGAGIPADTATCDACLAELLDPTDRRHRHPFISCTDCGPRYTIVRAIPYDRERTTMAQFAMCDACRSEYEDPSDRRFHAETIACPDCGPQLSMRLEDAEACLLSGGIVAVKGIGGWHLACDATDQAAVARLRSRKHRDAKPFAVMTPEPEKVALVDRAALEGPVAPIVLARRRADAAVAEAVAPGSPWLGLMLPYTPVHHLLAGDIGRPLVLTSGNRTNEPIAIGDEEARERLGDIADAFLGHDRPIHRRCEDSVTRGGAPLRRSRGLTPRPLVLRSGARRPIVAAGADLKGAFCVVRGRQAFLSPHLGDLGSEAALRAFRADLDLYLDMLAVRPEVIAHDLHPDYRSTQWALAQDADLVGVQHHHAHAAACLAEHLEPGPALAIVLDGTGYGTDGTLWGGEVLRADLEGFERLAHLEPVPLPGGAAAIREPWRVAAAHLERAGLPVPWENWRLARQALAVNAPLSSGAGRVLDAIAAVLGVRETISYEGQAAIELEHLADGATAAPYRCRRVGGVIAGGDLVSLAAADLAAGRPRAEIAAAAQEGLASAFASAALDAGDDELVVLSGGCLTNQRIEATLRRELVAAGRRVLTHRRVPPNDGGIAYGQAAVAAARRS
jgi:hydrogenase maturation protein HypF